MTSSELVARWESRVVGGHGGPPHYFSQSHDFVISADDAAGGRHEKLREESQISGG